VGWKRWTVGVVLPVLLCVLPLAGTLCLLACDFTVVPATADAAHHHAAMHDGLPGSATDSIRLDAVAPLACISHVDITLPPTVGASRDKLTAPSHLATPAFSATRGCVRVVPVAIAHSYPFGSAPPITTPLVLRV
jgi:hypothetical protein